MESQRSQVFQCSQWGVWGLIPQAWGTPATTIQTTPSVGLSWFLIFVSQLAAGAHTQRRAFCDAADWHNPSRPNPITHRTAAHAMQFTGLQPCICKGGRAPTRHVAYRRPGKPWLRAHSWFVGVFFLEWCSPYPGNRQNDKFRSSNPAPPRTTRQRHSPVNFTRKST